MMVLQMTVLRMTVLQMTVLQMTVLRPISSRSLVLVERHDVARQCTGRNRQRTGQIHLSWT